MNDNTSNLSLVYAMLLPDAITVKCRFPDDFPRATGPVTKLYTYKALKGWGINVGDEVVVDTPSAGTKVVTVEVVDEYLDVEDKKTYKWIVCKVDRDAHSDLLEKEKNVAKHLQLRNRELQRQKLFAQLMEGYASENELRRELGLEQVPVPRKPVAYDPPAAVAPARAEPPKPWDDAVSRS